MKNFRFGKHASIVLVGVFFLISCKENSIQKTQTKNAQLDTAPPTQPKKELSKEFKKYWYAGNAEITSYTLEQARYGELREGTAVMIYVSEPFMPDLQVKADNSDASTISVLKLNATKNYLTGIYPYSIMTSSFFPVHDNGHALKVSFSSQEWCGQVYAQLNNRNDFEIMSHSYFATEADQNIHLDKTVMEDEIWNKIRINPEELPTGAIEILPSLEFIRLSHKELKAYKATASLNTTAQTMTYEISYPELERTLIIEFMSEFPYTIEGWTESFKGGAGQKAKVLTSKATLIKRIKTPYWQQNSNKDLYLRDSLGL